MTYRRRIIDDTLDDLFPHLAAIALEGAKGVARRRPLGSAQRRCSP